MHFWLNCTSHMQPVREGGGRWGEEQVGEGGGIRKGGEERGEEVERRGGEKNRRGPGRGYSYVQSTTQVWQSRIEIEYYSVTYFMRITKFDALSLSFH